MVYIFSKSNRKNKKYKVVVKFKSKPDETYHFGDSRHSQYRDSTPLKLYADKDHLDKKRQKAYFARHGKEAKRYSAKYFSHRFLWS